MVQKHLQNLFDDRGSQSPKFNLIRVAIFKLIFSQVQCRYVTKSSIYFIINFYFYTKEFQINIRTAALRFCRRLSIVRN